MKTLRLIVIARRGYQASIALVTCLMLIASFGAQAQDFPKITPELYDKLNASHRYRPGRTTPRSRTCRRCR